MVRVATATHVYDQAAKYYIITVPPSAGFVEQSALVAAVTLQHMELHPSGGSVIRGELFRAGKDGSNYKVRWFELTKRGDLSWGEGEAAALKGSQPLLGCQLVMEKTERVGKSESEMRFGFSLSPPVVGGRSHRLQASSLEERQLWVDALEKAAHPDAQRSALFSGGRVVTLTKRGKSPLGLELANSTDYMGVGAPGVVVTAVEADAAEAGLLVGDMLLMLGPTVLRNREVVPHTLAVVRVRVGRSLT